MTQPARPNDQQQQQSRLTELYIYLGRNMVQVGILLVLVAGGVIAFIFSTQKLSQQKVPVAVRREWTSKDWQESRYGHVDCVKDPHCRQFKRIYAEGGASKEAILKNMLAMDKTLTFEQLQENAPQYEGAPWAFEGKIFEIIYQQRTFTRDYILASIIIGEDEGKLISVMGDFATDFVKGDYVYVIGYVTGTSGPRMGPSSLKYRGKVVGLSARAMLRPSEAREILNGSGTN